MKNWKTPFVLAVCVATPLAAQTVFSPVPTNIVGQPVLQTGTPTIIAPNLVEGRELYGPQGIAVDTSSSPPILYVADTFNNRVLVWKNAAALSNGAHADAVIGQRDFYGVSAKGPGTDLSTGLSFPTALVVDSNGNLYVADSGNNRVVRYPNPLQQTTQPYTIDLVLGQPDTNSNKANQGKSAPTAQTLALVTSNAALRSGLAIDGSDLWVSDSGNNRVLRFHNLLTSSPGNDPAADLVLGQSSFTVSSLASNLNANTRTALNQPSGLAFDPNHRLFVTDDFGRVVVYVPPFQSGMLINRVLGISPATPNPPLPISASTVGLSQSVFFVGNNPFVVDAANSRILQYPPFDSWVTESSTVLSQPAIAVFGQQDFFSGQANQGQPQPSSSTFATPIAAVAANNTVFIADTGNNRVLVAPIGANGSISPATVVLGQVGFQYTQPNLIEGREFAFVSGFSNGIAQGGGGVVIDRTSNPPHMYVADPLNNRVLGFKDYRAVKPGATADLVIGQPDFFTAEVNYPKNDPTQPNDAGLSSPVNVALDSAGNLWVADLGNARVLRFARPFDQSQSSLQRANLVLGQSSFFTKITDASARNMSQPYGIAFDSRGDVAVSDLAFARVLLFKAPAGGDFTSGQAASTVFGQPDFGPPSQSTFSSPHGITIDSNDALYVADTGNSRIAVFGNVFAAPNNEPVILSIGGLNHPHSIYYDPVNVVFWVADTLNNQLLQYPNFNQLVANPAPTDSVLSYAPTGVTADPFGSPLSTEASTNRVAFFSPAIDTSNAAGGVSGRFSGNAANYFQRFAPGMLATIFAYTTNHFGSQTASASSTPVPTTLGDVQVFVGGIAAPLIYVSPSQINFQIPWEMQNQVGTNQEIRVVQASTGEVLATAYFHIDAISPGLFTLNATGAGQLAVLNQDNSVNSPSNPAKNGSIIQIFGTGSGLFSNPEQTGVPAAGANPTPTPPAVLINNGFVPQDFVKYSGAAPGFIGVWQINVMIPGNPGGPGPGCTPVVIVYNNEASSTDQYGDLRRTCVNTTP